jgi:hypothetical protein
VIKTKKKMGTNKELLSKGIKYLGGALPYCL